MDRRGIFVSEIDDCLRSQGELLLSFASDIRLLQALIVVIVGLADCLG